MPNRSFHRDAQLLFAAKIACLRFEGSVFVTQTPVPGKFSDSRNVDLNPRRSAPTFLGNLTFHQASASRLNVRDGTRFDTVAAVLAEDHEHMRDLLDADSEPV